MSLEILARQRQKWNTNNTLKDKFQGANRVCVCARWYGVVSEQMSLLLLATVLQLLYDIGMAARGVVVIYTSYIAIKSLAQYHC